MLPLEELGKRGRTQEGAERGLGVDGDNPEEVRVLGVDAAARILADVELSARLVEVRRSVLPGEFVAFPVDAQLVFAEGRVFRGFLEAEYIELYRLLDGIGIEVELEGGVKERTRKSGEVELEVNLSGVVFVVCNAEVLVGRMRRVVVELRNPGVGTAPARDVVATVVERGVAFVEHVYLAGVRAFGIAVVCLEQQVVAPARRKCHVGLVLEGVGERYLSGARTLTPDHGHAAEPVTAAVVLDGAGEMQLVGLHQDVLAGDACLGRFVLALLGRIAGIERHHHAAGFIVGEFRILEGVDLGALTGILDNLYVGVSAGKGLLEPDDRNARVVVDEHRAVLRLVARDDVYAKEFCRALVEVVEDGVAVFCGKAQNPDRPAVVHDFRALGVAHHGNLAAPQALQACLYGTYGNVFHKDIARGEIVGFIRLEVHVLEDYGALGTVRDTACERGETLDGDIYECAVLDDELALAVDLAFGTDKPVYAVAQVDVAVDGPAASRRKEDGFCAVVDSVLDGLGVVGTVVCLASVFSGNGGPVHGLLLGVVGRLGDGELHGGLGTVAELVVRLRGELDDFGIGNRFVVGLLGALDFRLELAHHDGAGE